LENGESLPQYEIPPMGIEIGFVHCAHFAQLLSLAQFDNKPPLGEYFAMQLDRHSTGCGMPSLMKSVALLFHRGRKPLLVALQLGLLAGLSALYFSKPTPFTVAAECCKLVVLAPDEKTFVTTSVPRDRDDSEAIPVDRATIKILFWSFGLDKPKKVITFFGKQLETIAYSPDSQRIVALFRNLTEHSRDLYVFDRSGNSLVSRTSAACPELAYIRAAFFASDGSLRGFTHDGREYEIWDLTRQQAVFRGHLPEWVRLTTPHHVDFDTDTVEMAERIEGNWESVLPNCYPAVLTGGSFTAVEPTALKPDGKMVCRVPIGSCASNESFGS
jgi:hypothetical protein